MYFDPTGHSVSLLIGIGISVLIGALSGAASYAVGQIMTFATTGKWNWSWGGFLGSIIGGAIGGAVSGILGASAQAFVTKFGSSAVKFLSKISHIVYKIEPKISAVASGFLGKASSMLIESSIEGKNYTSKQILINSAIVGGFSFFLSDGSPTSLFDDIEASLSGASSKTIGKIFATELSEGLLDNMYSYLPEFYYSLFGFERLTLHFAK